MKSKEKRKVRCLTVRVPTELHHSAKLKLFNGEKTFQSFFVEALEKLVHQ